jgi:GAF domain-containing protein
VIDLAEPQSGAMRQLMVLREPGMNRQSLTFQRSYTPDKPGQRRAKRAAIAEQGRLAIPESLLAELAGDGEMRSMLDALAPTSAIVMPLQARGALLGSLTFLLSGSQRQYGPSDLALAEELARRLSNAVDRMQGFQAPLE